MPTYRVTDPTSGRRLRLTGDSPPTEEELNQIFSQPAQESMPTTVGGIFGKVPLGKYNQGQRNIVGDVFERPGAANRAFIRGLVPGGKTPVEAYREAAINPTKEPTFQESFSDKFDTLSKKHPYLKFVGHLPMGTLPIKGKQVVEMAGQVADIATNPADLLTLVPGLKVAPKVIKGMEKTVSGVKKAGKTRAYNKAEKITTEILQPSKGELASYLERGKPMPAIEEMARTIKKSKNYTELRQNVDNSIKKVMDERNTILRQNNRRIGDYTKELKNYIDDLKAKGQATPSEIQQMEDVLLREKDFISKNPLDRLSGQSRKEYLQDLTDSLLQKTEHGDIIDTQPARNRALDKIRQGLRKEVEGNNYKIKELNSRYGGLREARKLVAGQEALAQKAVPEKLMVRLLRFLTHPQDIPAEVARGALERNANLFNKTKAVQKLVTRANVK